MDSTISEGVKKYASTEEFEAYLKEKNVKFTYEGRTEAKKDRVRVRYSAENVETVEMTFFFSEDCEDVAVRVFNFVKVPKNKTEAIYKTLNEQNNRFRFVKFCLDENDNTVQAEIDVPFRKGSIGAVCYEVIGRVLNICDNAYPVFMKTIFA